MTVAVQRMFGILERWNNNQVTPSLSKPHELSYRSNIPCESQKVVAMTLPPGETRLRFFGADSPGPVQIFD